MTTAVPAGERPVLWQLQISHYNEKVRWALDYKRVAHARRSMMPGAHRVMTQRLAGIDTSPVLQFEDGAVGDSTAILQAIEERYPEPPLMPSDPDERERALEIEEFFDEELGPHIRRAVYWELLGYPEVVIPLFTDGATATSRAMLRTSFPVLRVCMQKVMNIYEAPAARSREKCIAAVDRLEAELDGNDYLVGDRFSVADRTAASLLYPLALPPAYPYTSPRWDDLPQGARDFLDPLRRRPGATWVAEMYRRHRLPA